MEEAGIIGQLGINWKLFLSQAFNFFILLLVLHRFVYKPLLKTIKERNAKIQEGLAKAHEADTRLHEVDVIAAGKLKKVEAESIAMLKATEQRARAEELALQKVAEAKHKEAMEHIKAASKLQQEKMQEMVFANAANLVKQVVAKTVELKPDAIDEALIKKAVARINE